MQQVLSLQNEIKSQINNTELKAVLKEFKGLKEENLKKILSSSGIIDELSKKLTIDLKKEKEFLDPKLTLKLQSGVGFSNEPENCFYSLEIWIWKSRIFSEKILAGSNPNFDSSLDINLAGISFQDWISNVSRLHAVVVKEDNHAKSLVGVGDLDLRKEICAGKRSAEIVLRDLHDDQIITGTLNLQISLVVNIQQHKLDQEAFKIKKEEVYEAEKYKSFVNYSKKWWNDFLEIRSSHALRLVKIFVHSESGKRTIVSKFIYPIKGIALAKLIKVSFLDTPRHAARFVSLIPFEKSNDSALSSDIWPDLHTFLVFGQGSLIEHAILLCNLLLGFSLEAYIALGTDKNNQSYSWVAVYKNDKVNFWDPLTGSIFTPSKTSNINSIGCLFNNSKFYANIQICDNFDSKFKFSDSSQWKELILPVSIIKNKIFINPHPLLSKKEELETDILSDLKKYIQIYRSDHSLSCIWDEELSYIQKQSLWHQELKELIESQDPDFESCIISSLSPGTIYRGYPTCFGHLNAISMFQSLSRNKSARRILLTTGDQVRLALSIRVFFYGECSLVVWVLASVIFK